MSQTATDLEDEVDGLQQRLKAVAAPTPAMQDVAAELAAAWGERDTPGYADALDSARRAFHALPENDKRQALNGWTPQGPRPDRAELLAAMELLDIRSVLSFTSCTRTIIPSRQWAFCDGSAPVRLEIQEGATLEDFLRAIGRFHGFIATLWPSILNQGGVAVLAARLESIDLLAAEKETAAARMAAERAALTPSPQAVAASKASFAEYEGETAWGELADGMADDSGDR